MDERTRFLLAKMLGLLGSDQDGEVLAAARSIRRLLESRGLTFGDLVNAVSGASSRAPQAQSANSGLVHMAQAILQNELMMKSHEARFVRDVLTRASYPIEYALTEKQARWFSFLYAKYAEDKFGA